MAARKKKTARRRGAPKGSGLKKTPERIESILEWISNGRTLRDWCRKNEIHYSTVYDWKREDAEFSQRFEDARLIGADALAEQALEIAANPLLGEVTTVEESADGKTTTKTVTSDNVPRSALHARTIQQLLGKWFPTKYGDKVQIGGAEDLPPVAISDEAKLEEINSILEKAKKRARKK